MIEAYSELSYHYLVWHRNDSSYSSYNGLPMAPCAQKAELTYLLDQLLQQYLIFGCKLQPRRCMLQKYNLDNILDYITFRSRVCNASRNHTLDLLFQMLNDLACVPPNSVPQADGFLSSHHSCSAQQPTSTAFPQSAEDCRSYPKKLQNQMDQSKHGEKNLSVMTK